MVDDNSGLIMLRAIVGTCALESGSKPGSGALGAGWASVLAFFLPETPVAFHKFIYFASDIVSLKPLSAASPN